MPRFDNGPPIIFISLIGTGALIVIVVLAVAIFYTRQELRVAQNASQKCCANCERCPNAQQAEQEVTMALNSTRTSYDQEFFTKWIYENYEQNLQHLTGFKPKPSRVSNHYASPSVIHSNSSRSSQYINQGSKSDITNYSLPPR